MPSTELLLSRANSMLGSGTVYWPAHGGFAPQAATAADTLRVAKEWSELSAADRARYAPLAKAANIDVNDASLEVQACDCSGFVCWAIGISRIAGIDGKGQQIWINTDSIYADAIGDMERFQQIDSPEVGCLVVYPQAGSGEPFGHIGIVTQVDASGNATSVIHCSATNFKTSPPDAIKVTGLEKFQSQSRTIYAWCIDVQRAAGLASNKVAPMDASPVSPSGAEWVARFPGSNDPQACVSPFREGLLAFLQSLADAGAAVQIIATLRPPERAYLMHWAWLISHNMTPAVAVPPMAGVNIDWVHRNSSGSPDTAKSRPSASQMVAAFGLITLPALQSRHTEGRAVDMDITWGGSLRMKDGAGAVRVIASEPRCGTNEDLIACGLSFGVVKAVFEGDPPHWSADGH